MTRKLMTGLRDNRRSMLIAALVPCCLALPGMRDVGYTQATSPITSSGLNTTVTQQGTTFDITGGTRPGSGPNLFHSFGEFGVPASHIANFRNDAALPTSNILGRVTGGNPSNIFGTIQTTGFGAANLFLMNPAGILFGPNASLNVGGSVSFTTADYLRLADGARFNAIPGSLDASVTSAPVAAYGFLGSNPGAITVQGSQLSVMPDQSIALVGGDINVRNGMEHGAPQPAKLSAQGGHIQLASAASPGELLAGTLDLTSNINGQSPGALGTIGVSQQSTLDVSGEHGGTISIRGGRFVLNEATLIAKSSGGNASTPPAAITITAEELTLNNGSYITTDTSGAAPAGNITFNAGTLTTTGGPVRLHVFPESRITNPIISQTGVLVESSSTSLSATAGRAGTITIQGIEGPGSPAKTVSLNDTILHTRSFGGTAATSPGTIAITADLVTLSDQVEIYAPSMGSAPAGNVVLNVNTLQSNLNADGSFIDGLPVLIGGPSENVDTTAGAPGAVYISGPAAESHDPAKLIALSNTEIDTFVVNGSASKPGPIIVTADTVALNNLTIFVTTSAGAAPAGDIAFHVDTLRVNTNPDGTPITNANRVFLNSPSGSLDSNGGPPGTVTISGIGPENTDAARLVALYNAQISTATEGGTAALPPGTITITADTMTMSGKTWIFSFTSGPAPAGNVAINVNTLRANVNPDDTLINGQIFSQITSHSIDTKNTAGRAGTVTISGLSPQPTDPARLIALNNTDVSTTVKGGTAGTIPATVTMTADTLNLTNSPNIATDTSGGAPAGNITLDVNSLTADQGTKISSSTSGTGPGGTISINAGRSVTLTNQSSITAGSSGPANAGNIAINAGAHFLSQNASITTEANQASGGNIVIRAIDSIRLINSQLSTSVQGGPTTSGGNILLDPAVVTLQNSQVLAQAVQGQGGNINIIAGTFLADSASVVSASSQFGLSGSVNIQSPVSSLSNTLTTLPQRPLQVQHLLQQRCAAQANGHLSSLVIAGRDALPTEPGGWLMSPLAFEADDEAIPGAHLTTHRTPDSLETWEYHSEQFSAQSEVPVQRGVWDRTTGCGS